MDVTKTSVINIFMTEEQAKSLKLMLGNMDYHDIKLATERQSCSSYRYSDYENTEKLWRALSNVIPD